MLFLVMFGVFSWCLKLTIFVELSGMGDFIQFILSLVVAIQSIELFNLEIVAFLEHFLVIFA